MTVPLSIVNNGEKERLREIDRDREFQRKVHNTKVFSPFIIIEKSSYIPLRKVVA